MMRKLPLLLISAALLGGCENESDIDKFIRSPGVSGAKIQPLPEVKPLAIADYDKNAIRDPFTAKLAIASVASVSPGSPDTTRPRQPLENYSLELLKMTGFVVIDNKPYALVLDSDRQVHRVTTGNYMGQDYGRVISVTRQGIKLVESVQDNAGGWSERKVEMPFVEKDTVGAAPVSSKPADTR